MAEGLLKRLHNTGEHVRKKPTTKPVVLPYINNVAHIIKEVGQKHCISVVFSAPLKWGRLCANVDRGRQNDRACELNNRTEKKIRQVPSGCCVPGTVDV